jgi:transcriptional regulator GlxA family with amidase domain
MDVSDQLVDIQDPPSKPRRFVFVLLKDFTMLCFSAAVESLRIANRMSGRELYSWTLMSETGEPVTCSACI